MIKRLAGFMLLAAAGSWTTTAFAAQFGFGYAGVGGTADSLDEDLSFDTRSGEFGFLFDTGRGDKTFNYRLLLSYVAGTAKNFEDSLFIYEDDIDYKGLMLTNSFRFTLTNKEAARFWIGPSIYLGSLQFEYEDGEDAGDGGYFGIGPSLGIDIPLGDVATLALEAGYRYGQVAVDDDEIASDYEVSEFVGRIGSLFGR